MPCTVLGSWGYNQDHHIMELIYEKRKVIDTCFLDDQVTGALSWEMRSVMSVYLCSLWCDFAVSSMRRRWDFHLLGFGHGSDLLQDVSSCNAIRVLKCALLLPKTAPSRLQVSRGKRFEGELNCEQMDALQHWAFRGCSLCSIVGVKVADMRGLILSLWDWCDISALEVLVQKDWATARRDSHNVSL